MVGRSIRRSAVAGAFYPDEPHRLAALVRRLLEEAAPPPLRLDPRLVIVPHAGYVYSGPVAASAYAALAGATFTRVVVLGPSHFVPFPGLAIPAVRGFATPLGVMQIDAELYRIAGTRARTSTDAHLREHSLEVQLPFLQTILPEATVLPVLTGDGLPGDAADILDATVDTTTLGVISSDLSHYHDHATAQRLDRETAAAIVGLRPEDIGPDRACGRTAVQAALQMAAGRGWRIQQLDLRTSADTAGSPARVVGYGAFVAGPAIARR